MKRILKNMSDLFTAVYDGLFGGTKDKPKEDSF